MTMFANWFPPKDAIQQKAKLFLSTRVAPKLIARGKRPEMLAEIKDDFYDPSQFTERKVQNLQDFMNYIAAHELRDPFVTDEDRKKAEAMHGELYDQIKDESKDVLEFRFGFEEKGLENAYAKHLSFIRAIETFARYGVKPSPAIVEDEIKLLHFLYNHQQEENSSTSEPDHDFDHLLEISKMNIISTLLYSYLHDGKFKDPATDYNTEIYLELSDEGEQRLQEYIAQSRREQKGEILGGYERLSEDAYEQLSEEIWEAYRTATPNSVKVLTSTVNKVHDIGQKAMEESMVADDLYLASIRQLQSIAKELRIDSQGRSKNA